MANPDPETLSALKRRDPGALALVVKEHAGTLLNAALGLGVGRADAEELVQATFAAFLDALPRFEGRSAIRTYLFGILYRKNLERGREKARTVDTDPADELFERRFGALGHWSAAPKGPEQAADLAEVARLIGECLDGLPAQQRAAFLLKEAEGETPEAVCNALEVTDTHLRVLLFRARNRLRECIEGKWAQS